MTVNLLLYPFVISTPLEPLHARLFTKPGQLTLRVVPRIFLNYTYHVSPRVTFATLEVRQYMTITDRAQRFRIFLYSTIDYLTDLLYQPQLEHPVNASVDALVGFIPK